MLVNSDSVDLIHLQPGRQFQWRDWWQKRLVYREPFKNLVFANPGLERVKLSKDYDLFIAMFQYHEDIPCVNAIENWKERCKTTVCWIDEIWAASIHRYRHWLNALRQFDYVFVGSTGGSAGPLSVALEQPCQSLPFAVDALRFCPYPKPVPRSVDVYSMGRRSSQLHQSLHAMADRKEIFYLYDTSATANSPVIDYGQHRDLLASLAQRSRYFVVAPSKKESLDETHGQIEFGPRYYEALTAGSVLIGQAPDTIPFRQLFDRPDVVVEVKPDGSDVAAVLRRLNSDPDQLQSMSRRNIVEGLLRHDWSYRWKNMFDVVGLEASPGMVHRQLSLQRLADQVASAGNIAYS